MSLCALLATRVSADNQPADASGPTDKQSPDHDEMLFERLHTDCPAQWEDCQAFSPCVAEFERTLVDTAPPASDIPQFKALVECMSNTKEKHIDEVNRAVKQCPEQSKACLDTEICSTEFRETLENLRPPQNGSDEMMALVECIEENLDLDGDGKPDRPSRDATMSAGNDEHDVMACHETCERCDVPHDRDSCLSCKGRSMLHDDDGDGAGQCVGVDDSTDTTEGTNEEDDIVGEGEKELTDEDSALMKVLHQFVIF